MPGFTAVPGKPPGTAKFGPRNLSIGALKLSNLDTSTGKRYSAIVARPLCEDSRAIVVSL